MGDKKLLELAAKAAGVEWVDGHENVGLRDFSGRVWSPLTDDGDALRLAVKLGLDVYCQDDSAVACGGYSAVEQHSGDPCAATRRAIVRAAAEIGKEMP